MAIVYRFKNRDKCSSLAATWNLLLGKTPFDPKRWDEYRFTLAFDDGSRLPFFRCSQQSMYEKLALPWSYLVEVEDDEKDNEEA